MSDTSKPVEYEIQATAGEAGAELSKIVGILERLETSVKNISDVLTQAKAATSGFAKAFDKFKLSNDGAFDTKRVLGFEREMLKLEQLGKRLGKSNNIDNMALSNSLTHGVKEARRLNDIMNSLDPATPEYAAVGEQLKKQLSMLDELKTGYEEAEKARRAAIPNNTKQPTARDNQTQELPRTAKLGSFVQYDSKEILPEDEDEEIKVDVKIEGLPDLARAEREIDSLNKKIERNKNNIVRFQVSGDTRKLARETRQLEINQAALEEWRKARAAAAAAKADLAEDGGIEILNPEQYVTAEKVMKRLETSVRNTEAELRRFAAAGDASGAEKTTAKLDKLRAELERYKAALAGASNIKLEIDNTKSLEDAYKRIEKLTAQIADKRIGGKRSVRSSAFTKLQMDLTKARLEANRLEMTLGHIGTGKAFANNVKLAAKHFLQSRIHAAHLRKELKRSQRKVINITRTLSLMAVRMGVRSITKDIGQGLAALAQGFEPFNRSMSDLMDASTRVRNSVVSMLDPLIRTAAPIAIRMLDRLANGFEKIAQAMAAMGGNTTYQKLTSEAQNYADTVNEVKNSLAGFDKFNTIGGGSGGSNNGPKTDIESLPISEELMKWKHIGEGLKEVYEGAEGVIVGFVNRFADALGRVGDEDAFEFLGRMLKGVGSWLKENKELCMDLVGAFIALKTTIKVAQFGGWIGRGVSKAWNLGAALFGKGAAAGANASASVTAAATFGSGIKSAFSWCGTHIKSAGLAVASGVKTAFSWSATQLTAAGTAVSAKLSAVGASLGTKLAATGAKLSAAGSTVLSSVAALPTGALAGGAAAAAGAVVYAGVKELTPEIKQFNSDLKQYAKDRTGEEQNFLEALKILFEDKWRDITGKPIRQYASGGILPNRGQLFVANERGPELVGNFGGQTGVLNQSGIVEAVSAGVARAVAQVLSSGKGNANVNVTVRASADTDKLFKFVVEQNNSQFNRTGRSPLKI